jgi:hypothetical protein
MPRRRLHLGDEPSFALRFVFPGQESLAFAICLSLVGEAAVVDVQPLSAADLHRQQMLRRSDGGAHAIGDSGQRQPDVVGGDQILGGGVDALHTPAHRLELRL